MRKIVVEALVPAPVELVWQRTQDPELHTSWDIRFDSIRYLPEMDARGYHLMDYRTRIGFGLEVQGVGRYLHSTPNQLSSFEFDSGDWKSLIREGRGIWAYEERGGATRFKTVYDYGIRHGWLGRIIDRLWFRPLLRLATEWSFETLRRWCAGSDERARRRSRLRFLGWLLGRMFRRPPEGAARSWLGSGKESCP
jgi:uncharacterized protein YndB with AHSA1/START domain